MIDPVTYYLGTGGVTTTPFAFTQTPSTCGYQEVIEIWPDPLPAGIIFNSADNTFSVTDDAVVGIYDVYVNAKVTFYTDIDMTQT